MYSIIIILEAGDSYGQSQAAAGGWLRGAGWRGATDIFKMLGRAGRVIVAGETRTPGPEMKVAHCTP